MNQKISQRRCQRGQGLLEFALVTPLLILVLSGVTHIGLMLHTQQIITNASRVGARRASQPNGTSDTVRAVVSNYCRQAGLDGTVNVQVNLDQRAGKATVTVVYRFHSPVQQVFQSLVGQSMALPNELHATTIMSL